MTVEGGLEEPEELQPVQGSLALLLPGDEHRREDWDRAAAGVLRKTGRMTADSPDSEAWERLCRRTLDGIDVPPLGTPDLVRGLDTGVRPTRSGAWDTRVRLGGGAAGTLNAEALKSLPDVKGTPVIPSDADTTKAKDYLTANWANAVG